ncbi:MULTISPECIES: AAA family ATPase [unclassified Roseofilum]|uniref:AAA family ATPase n=1 Tax=unclassified Roseofilum TaxID=2620099 RepID=UPI000E902F3B|nr:MULTISPECIES: AAA family ATPase [unclassified Roseofilum]MBP0010567.1 hypothetical protein [Roseofilum sp. Belize Diploria]MBP0035013.1 hypothetical protein [Roseofilum sp. Belize BBD 4]HBQ97984.1 hypothetical protein [Cyanobacteria bacterium UBA11691]
MIQNIVFIGPHASGKSTLGKALATALDWQFDEEIGYRIRQEVLALNPQAYAHKNQPDFDFKVMQEELKRDDLSVSFRVIETWHPGNFAFAEARSPEVAIEFKPIVDKIISKNRKCTLVQPLLINLETAILRFHEPGSDKVQLANWFMTVGRRAIEIADEWDLQVCPTIFTDLCSIDEAVEMVFKNINQVESSQ